jgi:hypothetical protein
MIRTRLVSALFRQFVKSPAHPPILMPKEFQSLVYILHFLGGNRNDRLNEFCSRFGMAVPFILHTVRRSSVWSFVERDFFIIILFQVYFDFA